MKENKSDRKTKIILFGKTWSIRNVTAKACPKEATIGKELSTIKERPNLPWNRVRLHPAKLPDFEMKGPMIFCFGKATANKAAANVAPRAGSIPGFSQTLQVSQHGAVLDTGRGKTERS